MKVGDLVVPGRRVRYDACELTIWRTIDEETMDQVEIVPMGSLLLVLEVRKATFKYPSIGWKRCIKVLTSNGNVGWVGDGWISCVTTDT